jgi:uncharacterized membrane protein YvbJ
MALIHCPECGTEVSDKAEKCPKCAYPINPVIQKGATNSNNQPIKVQEEGCFLQTMNMGCQVIAFIIAVIIILILIALLTS